MITTELEKLATLRDKGDLSAEEFEQAKQILLSSAETEVSDSSQTAEGEPKESPKTALIIAILSTLSVLFAAGSAMIAPTVTTLIVLGLFIVTATLSWSSYSKAKKSA